LESSESTSNTEQTPSSQIAFNDRVSAAQILANLLENTVKKIIHNKDEVLVLGIPRGGAIVADIVASKLDYDFDVVFPRKMSSIGNKVNTIGAVMSDGTTYFDESLIESLKISQEFIKKEKFIQLQEISLRKDLYRSNKSSEDYGIQDKVVILVDDRIATGSTALAAARWIRKQNPKHLIIASPVSQIHSISILKQEADTVVIVSTLTNNVAVGQVYKTIEQELEDQVVEVLKRRKLI